MPHFFFVSLLLTALTIITPFGQQIHGSARWLSLPFISFQPSELLKISLMLYLAYFLPKKEKMNASLLHGFIPLLIILGATSVILLKQPDFGLTFTLIATTFFLLFLANIYLKYFGITLLALIPLADWIDCDKIISLKACFNLFKSMD